ncbi:MAG TPA: FkbM family methyltransferase [Caldithrix abyssi]|uniref:FkbM family methyltransferase n=1 Tax=Caldithrix abyssi TaxID=187145 RepID=A0A7V5H2R1_CALAY|nr:FkbM family methyltransferase [Caldisericaceae bacterium]HHE54766.1 FkbM family methyltransferase [Caldithrix abyssi]
MLNRLLKLETKLNNEKHWAYKNLHFFLDRLNARLPLRVNGKFFWIPIIYGMGLYHLLKTEFFLAPLIRKLYNLSDGAFIDVDANIGQTLLRFKSLGTSEKYVGFEPNAGAFFYLSELIKVNRFQNCLIFPFPLSAHSGVQELFKRHRVDTSSTLVQNYKSFANDGNQTLMFTLCGDQLVHELGNLKINLIKIDVEGSELEVICGFKTTLRQHRPFVICEILPVYHLKSDNLRMRKERQDLLLKFLKTLGYQFFVLEIISICKLLKKLRYIPI